MFCSFLLQNDSFFAAKQRARRCPARDSPPQSLRRARRLHYDIFTFLPARRLAALPALLPVFVPRRLLLLAPRDPLPQPLRSLRGLPCFPHPPLARALLPQLLRFPRGLSCFPLRCFLRGLLPRLPPALPRSLRGLVPKRLLGALPKGRLPPPLPRGLVRKYLPMRFPLRKSLRANLRGARTLPLARHRPLPLARHRLRRWVRRGRRLRRGAL